MQHCQARNFHNNGNREMEFASFDGGKDYKHDGFGFVEISEIYVMQIEFFDGVGGGGMAPFDAVELLLY